jgi:hypothetical protein
MTSKVAVLSLVTLCVAVFQRADAFDLSRTPSRDQSSVVLKISELRSAYLQRSGIVRYDESNSTPDGLRQQLQRHFDVVLTLLSSATPGSIETAAARLEAADDHSWTAEERTAWRQKLLAARREQLHRLAAYRARGTFPLNEGQSAHAAPIFVDRHGTACAVGHLMRCSGWNDDVDAIRKSNNLVYVPDATQHSAIAAWVLTSGLTLEEAALIQPGYYWGSGEFDASAYEPGESVIEKDGLRFSNFKLQAQNYTITPPNTAIPVSTGAKPTIAGLGLKTAKGTYNPSPSGFPRHIPIGTNWIAIGGSTAFVQSPLHSLNASAAAARGQMVVVSFDVAAIAADQRINGISETSYSLWQGFQDLTFDGDPPASAIYYLKTTARDGATSLASLNIDQLTSQRDTQSFAPTQQLSVESTVWLRDGVKMNTYLLDFNVVSVPEPATSGFLAVVLVATCRLVRNREQRRGLARFRVKVSA